MTLYDIGIMQPYFFPYLGYFDLICKTRQWVVFDVVNYKPRSWMNRNRILEANNGEQYIQVPVDKYSGKRIDQIRIKDIDQSLEKIIGQLHVYYKKAPFYKEIIDLINQAFADSTSDLLRDLNIQTIQKSCDRLGIPFNPNIASNMNLELSNVSHAGQWALEIADQTSSQSYLNPPGGRDIFKLEEWLDKNISLHFTRVPEFHYETHNKLPFRPNLSIVDVMMWNSPEKISSYLSTWPINN